VLSRWTSEAQALSVRGPADAYTLVFQGLRDDDRWFVRTGEYTGVCAALAFDHPLVLPPGSAVDRDITVVVADGVLSREQVNSMVR